MSVAELDRVPKPGVRMTVEEFESHGLSEDSSLILASEIVCDENGGNPIRPNEILFWIKASSVCSRKVCLDRVRVFLGLLMSG